MCGSDTASRHSLCLWWLESGECQTHDCLYCSCAYATPGLDTIPDYSEATASNASNDCPHITNVICRLMREELGMGCRCFQHHPYGLTWAS